MPTAASALARPLVPSLAVAADDDDIDLSRYTQQDIDLIRTTLFASGLPDADDAFVDEILGPDPRLALLAAWDRREAAEAEADARRAAGRAASPDTRRAASADNSRSVSADGGQRRTEGRRTEAGRTEGRLSRSEQARINGAKSRGPTTEAGKTASSRNAVKHGLTSRFVLLADEDWPAFEQHLCNYAAALNPSDAVQEDLCRRAAELAWRLRRMPAMESTLFTDVDDLEQDPTAYAEQTPAIDMLRLIVGKAPSGGQLVLLQRYETRLERSLQACLREIRLLKQSVRTAEGAAPGSFGAGVGAGPMPVGLASVRTVAASVGATAARAAPSTVAPPAAVPPTTAPPTAPGSFGTADTPTVPAPADVPVDPPLRASKPVNPAMLEAARPAPGSFGTAKTPAQPAAPGSIGTPTRRSAWPTENEVLPVLTGRSA